MLRLNYLNYLYHLIYIRNINILCMQAGSYKIELKTEQVEGSAT